MRVSRRRTPMTMDSMRRRRHQVAVGGAAAAGMAQAESARAEAAGAAPLARTSFEMTNMPMTKTRSLAAKRQAVRQADRLVERAAVRAVQRLSPATERDKQQELKTAELRP